MRDNKKVIILLIGLLAFVMVIGRVSYSYFTYNKEVATATVESGSINIDFSNSNSNLSLSNLVPMSDSMGVISNNYVDFTVTGTVDTEKIYYEVYLLEKDGNTINPDYIKVYLTDQNDITIQNVIAYSSLPDSEKQNGKRIYRDVVEPNSNGTEKTETKYFRLRMWLDENYTATSSSVFASGIYLYAYNVDRDFEIPDGARVMKKAIAAKTSCTPTRTDVNNAGIGGEGNVIYFSGAESCVDFNYVWYSGKLWRITAIYPDGTMKLVTENPMTLIYFGSSVTFNNSFVDQWLSQEFLPTLYNYQDIVVQNAEWNVTKTTATTDPYLLSNSTTINRTLGLLNSYEYTQAGVQSQNYLSTGMIWWLMNPCNSSVVCYVESSVAYATNRGRSVRPVIYLKSNVSFSNINETNVGKRSNPYRISGDKAIGANGETLNQRLSGEYVRLTGGNNNNLLYRIVGVEDGKTKIVSASYVQNPNSSNSNKIFGYFGTDNKYNTASSTNEYWDNYLTDTENGFVSTLSSNTQNMLDIGTYYLGSTIRYDTNYKTQICATYNANISTRDCVKISNSTYIYTGKVGLLRYGEMMASQSSPTVHTEIDSSYKNMWLITAKYGSGDLMIISSPGLYSGAIEMPSSNSYAVRPTLHLNAGVTITGGSGTANDPYTITLSS